MVGCVLSRYNFNVVEKMVHIGSDTDRFASQVKRINHIHNTLHN